MADGGWFAEAPPEVAQRRMKSGHILRPPSLVPGSDNLYQIRCEGDGCGWVSAPFLRRSDQEELAQRRAWEHRTQPTLLTAGSSDILPAMRFAQVRAELDALVAKHRPKG